MKKVIAYTARVKSESIEGNIYGRGFSTYAEGEAHMNAAIKEGESILFYEIFWMYV